jgi:hypothetical protein
MHALSRAQLRCTHCPELLLSWKSLCQRRFHRRAGAMVDIHAYVCALQPEGCYGQAASYVISRQIRFSGQQLYGSKHEEAGCEDEQAEACPISQRVG